MLWGRREVVDSHAVPALVPDNVVMAFGFAPTVRLFGLLPERDMEPIQAALSYECLLAKRVLDPLRVGRK